MPTYPHIDAACPTCSARLLPMDTCAPETVGVCPACGELVRRKVEAVVLYSEEEEADAHPEVLAKLRKIQAGIREANTAADAELPK